MTHTPPPEIVEVMAEAHAMALGDDPDNAYVPEMRAALQAAAEAGWVLMRAEPDKDMLNAGVDAEYKHYYGDRPKTSHSWLGISPALVSKIYKAMLLAAHAQEKE